MSHTNTAYLANLSPNELSDDDQAIGEVCIANISPRERRKRLIFATQQSIITVVILGAMIALRLDPLWRLLLFFLFSASTVSFFQVLDKT